MSRKKTSFHINFLIAFALIFSMLTGVFMPAQAKSDKPPRIDPDFLALVQDNPEDNFKVIVQKDAKNKDLKEKELEDLVEQGGGRVGKQLGMIVSFAADMTGKEVEKMAKSMCATPFDGLTNHREGFQAALDARGLSAGFRFASEMRVFSVLQRPGSREGEFHFFDVREKKGHKAALEEMNAPYKKLGY